MAVVPRPGRGGVTVRMVVDRFLSSSRCANPNTRRAYASVLNRLAAELGVDRPLAGVTDQDVTAALQLLWGRAAPATWNQRIAAAGSWLGWCARSGHRGPALPGAAVRRPQGRNGSRVLTRSQIERLLSRPDVPLREKTLWWMLFETAAQASEILALNIEDLDLDGRRAAVRSEGGATGWISWAAGTAHLLPRLIHGRSRGPVFLTERRPGPARRPAPADLCPHTGRARLGYDRARVLLAEHTVPGDGRPGWELHQLQHPATPG